MQFIGNNNYFVGRNGYAPKYIILHGTAGGTSAIAIANYFQSTQGTNNPVSAHHIIDQQGTIVQTVDEKNTAWANGYLSNGHDTFWNENINPNYLTISIEHVKTNTVNNNDLTEVQKQVSFQLIKDICNRWSIPKRKADNIGGITGHFSIDPVNRAHCPGLYPWDELFSYLEENMDLSNKFITDHFDKVSDTVIRRKNNGPTISNDILKYYLSIQACAGLPETAVHTIVINGKNVNWQAYERGYIIQDTQKALDNVIINGTDGTIYLIKIEQALSLGLLPTDVTLQQQLAKYKSAIKTIGSELVGL